MANYKIRFKDSAGSTGEPVTVEVVGDNLKMSTDLRIYDGERLKLVASIADVLYIKLEQDPTL